MWHVVQEEESKTSILGGPALPALGHAISGSLGSAISTVITYPLSLVITRLQVQKQLKNDRHGQDVDYKSVLDAIAQIYVKEGGIPAFYSGCFQDSAKSMADSFLFFLAYNFIRRGRLNSQPSGSKRLPVHEEIGVGMLSGAFAKLLTTPIQNIVTRKQIASMVEARSSNSTISPELSTRDIALQIRHEKGIMGFWSGYSASLVLTLNPALTFLFHESLLRMLVKREKRSNPGARLTFLIAAVSKVLASTITYPFSLAKSRAQVSSKAPDDGATESLSEKDSLKEVSNKSARNLRRRTVFDAVLQIVKEEGVSGLYHGLEGELMKGFFSHGLTMLLKERIHKVVIQLYYLVLKAMKQYPSPEELAKLAGDKATDLKDRVGEKMAAASSGASDLAHNTLETGKQAIRDGKEQVNGTLGKGQEVLERGIEAVSHLYQRGKEDTLDLVDEYVDTGEDDD
jgi:hypothetical protein